MREIKFKAVYKNRLFPVRSIEFFLDGSYSLLLMDSDGIFIPDLQYVGDIIQFTGLKDKENDEIYEGDIVQISKYDGSLKVNHTIEFKDGNFIFADYPHANYAGQRLGSYKDSNITIIGNIYENPELLKKG